MPVLTKINRSSLAAGVVGTTELADEAIAAIDLAPDSVGASEIAAGAVGISELATVTGVTAEYHKVPTFANDAARDHATTGIPSPAVGMLIYNTNSGAVQQYNGAWSTIAPAPNITGVSGFLNNDTDSTITVFGTNFSASSVVKMFSAASGGSQIGSDATTTFNSSLKLTAVFGAGSIGASGSAAYIEVDNVGATNRFATVITVNADPTVVHAGATGTSANTTTHLGTYGIGNTGGGTDANTVLLLNFDRADNSTDFEDSSNTGGIGHKVTASGNVHIDTASNIYKFGTAAGKVNNSSAYFDGTGDSLSMTTQVALGTGAYTFDFWIYYSSTQTSSTNAYIWDGGLTSSVNIIAIYVVKSTNRMVVYDDGTNVNVFADAAALALTNNTWTHVALVRETTSTNGTKLYYNGTLVATGTSGGDLNNSATDPYIGGYSSGSHYFTGYIDSFRISNTARWATTFTPSTLIYGAKASKTIPTITLTGTATQLAADEDIEFTSVVNPTKTATNQHLTDTGIGLTLTNLTGGDKNKATLTGTIASAASTTHTNMAIKAQVRKSLGDAAYNNSTLVTFSGSTTTAGLSPGMPLTGTGISIAGPLTCGITSGDATVTAASTTGLVVGMQVNAFTGVPAGATILSISANVSFELSANATATDADAKLTFNTIISAVPSTTTLTLSNVTTGGSLSSQTLIFEDLTRVAHVNGTEVFDGTQAMMTIATGSGAVPVLFNARRYHGTGVARSITGFGFKPDMVWFKAMNTTDGHHLYDSIRGVTKSLATEAGATESTQAQGLTLFDTDGYSVGTAATHNAATTNYVSWGWKAGGAPSGNNKSANGTATEDDIATTFNASTDSYNGVTANATQLQYVKRSVNTAGGFSITECHHRAGGNNADVPIPHGLGAIPDMVIIRALDGGDWFVVHKNQTSNSTLNNTALVLNSTANEAVAGTMGSASTAYHTYTTNNAAHDHNDADQKIIVYAWKAVAEVSHFGSYTGAAGAATISGLGFRPKFIMIKALSGDRSWVMADVFTGFGAAGASDTVVFADSATVYAGTVGITTTSDGWTMNTDNGHLHYSGNYIYAAFA